MDEENTTLEDPEESNHLSLEPKNVNEYEQSSVKDILQNLNVLLSVELGKTSISISELGDLRSGHIIELNKVPGDSVDLIIGGKKIGEGLLVNIEGEIGVRITSLVEK